MVIIGQMTLREKLGTVVKAQLEASVLKTHGRELGPEMEITAGGTVGEPKAGAVVPVAMAVLAFGPGGNALGDVDDGVTLTLLSQRLMMFQDFEVEVQDHVGALETAVTDEVDYGVRPECAKMLRAISFFAGFARALTYSVGRCWATRLRTWSV